MGTLADRYLAPTLKAYIWQPDIGPGFNLVNQAHELNSVNLVVTHIFGRDESQAPDAFHKAFCLHYWSVYQLTTVLC